MEDVQKRIEEINRELQRHDEAFEQLEEDLKQVKHEYTKELIKSHMGMIINNVIILKEELERLEKSKEFHSNHITQEELPPMREDIRLIEPDSKKSISERKANLERSIEAAKK
jgi:hypothetical protein